MRDVISNFRMSQNIYHFDTMICNQGTSVKSTTMVDFNFLRLVLKSNYMCIKVEVYSSIYDQLIHVVTFFTTQ